MWRDIGLGYWLLALDDDVDITRLVPTVLAMVKDLSRAGAKIGTAREYVRQRQRETMALLRNSLGL